ncbi:MAG: T9SS type A sorting domain-containing protein [Phaeodactylibacter sp.]|nr:T9SS type A sorting domain-containing protein [Phaeodactylibacter sp.]
MKQVFFTLLVLFQLSQLRAQPSCFSMYISTEAATPGQMVCLDVKAEGIDNLLGFQYAMRWDTSALHFDHLENFNLPGLNNSSFSTQPAAVDNGRLSVSWFDGTLSGVDVSGGQVAYSICFDVLNAPAALHSVYFNGDPTPIEFSNANTQLVTNYALINGGAYTGTGSAPAITSACALPPDCQGGEGSIDITTTGGQPGYTFDWRKGGITVSTNEDLTGDIGGRYSLQLTDQQGLEASALFSLVPEGLPFINNWEVGDASCSSASDGSLSVSIPGGVGNANLLWNTGATTNYALNLAPGTYTLEVSNDAGCSYEEFYTVGLSDEPVVEAYYTYECSGDTANYTADVSCTVTSGGTPPFTFSWNTGQIDTNPQSSTINGVPGIAGYSVTITDASGCVQAMDTFELDCGQSSQFLTGYAYECQFFGDGSTLADVSLAVWSGGTPPYTFEWSNGEIDTDSLFSVNQGLANGVYAVTITDANGLLHYPEPAIVDCEPAPQDFIVGSNSECTYFPAEDSVSIDISALVWAGPVAPYTFSWSTGEVETDTLLSTITVSAAGTYSVTITDAAGNMHVEAVNALNCGPAGSQLAIGETSGLAGEMVCVDVTAAQVQDLDSLLLAIQWNPGFMTLDNVQPGLITSGFDMSETTAGIFQLNWSSGGQPVATTGPAVLFQLCFLVLAPAGQSISLDFHTSLQAPEAYDSNGQAVDFDWQGGAILVENDTPGNAVGLQIESATVETETAACLEITTTNFTDILGVQFTVRWDADSLQFDSLVYGALPGLTPANFNLNNTGSGFLQFSWLATSLQPTTLSDGAGLFSLCFTTAASPGASTVAISSVPTLIEVTDGNTVLPVAITNGSVVTVQPQVWPGDTDTDENVNHLDLLNLGLAYGAAGPLRPNASIGWIQQPAPDWQQTTPLSLVDYKHIDTDGNGLIDAADTLAIVQNWGLEAEGEGIPPADMEFSRQLSTVLYVKPDTVVLGLPAVFDVILGDESAPAENIYGLAFTIVYDTAAVEPGSASMTFGNSWMGQQSLDLLALSRDHYNSGRLDVALTRIDGQNVSGQGVIAQLHITIQDVIFLRQSEYEMMLEIENVRLINNAEEWTEVVSQPSTISIGGTVSSTDNAAPDASLKAYPVPTNGRIFIHSPQYPVQQVEVLGMDGRSLLIRKDTYELSVGELPAGPYLLRVWTEGGVSVRRIMVVRE